jgi:hypothetical protein
MKRAQIYQAFTPHLEIYFTHKGTKFNFTGTSTDEDGHTFHEILNPATRVYKSVPHSVLSEVVDFESGAILIK